MNENEDETNDEFVFPTSNGHIRFIVRPPPPPPPLPEIDFTLQTNNSFYQNPVYNEFLTPNIIINRLNNLDVLNNSLHETESFKQVLSDKGKEQIKFRTFNDNTDDIKKCPILFTDFEEDDDVAELPCKHIFEKDAIITWLEKQDASCPVCREKLESMEVKNDDDEDEDMPLPAPSHETYLNRLTSIINNTEERMMQMAIEASLLD